MGFWLLNSNGVGVPIFNMTFQWRWKLQRGFQTNDPPCRREDMIRIVICLAWAVAMCWVELLNLFLLLSLIIGIKGQVLKNILQLFYQTIIQH